MTASEGEGRVGRGASAEMLQSLRQAILDGGEFTRIVHMTTVHLGPDELLVGAVVTVSSATTTAPGLALAIAAAKRRMRAAVPLARIVYLEPEPERGQPAAPVTDAIVIRGAD